MILNSWQIVIKKVISNNNKLIIIQKQRLLDINKLASVIITMLQDNQSPAQKGWSLKDLSMPYD